MEKSDIREVNSSFGENVIVCPIVRKAKGEARGNYPPSTFVSFPGGLQAMISGDVAESLPAAGLVAAFDVAGSRKGGVTFIRRWGWPKIIAPYNSPSVVEIEWVGIFDGSQSVVTGVPAPHFNSK